MKTINELINYAIKDEQAAIDFYEKLIDRLPNKSDKNKIEKIRNQEKKHKKKLNEMLEDTK
jgi:rubrerythrin